MQWQEGGKRHKAYFHADKDKEAHEVAAEKQAESRRAYDEVLTARKAAKEAAGRERVAAASLARAGAAATGAGRKG